MTPFGQAMRELRRRRGVTQRALAQAIGVTPAYLSALEHGHRGRPTFELLQRIAGYFNIIWDEADDLFRLADTSDPRVVIDTAGLPPEYTLLANQLSKRISTLTPEMVEEINRLLKSPQ
ncbi:anaerobic benzoate catabolism transcriptional regulator [compost metagenome]